MYNEKKTELLISRTRKELQITVLETIGRLKDDRLQLTLLYYCNRGLLFTTNLNREMQHKSCAECIVQYCIPPSYQNIRQSEAGALIHQ